MDTNKKEGILLSLFASFAGACVPVFSKLIFEYLSPVFTLLIRMLISLAIMALIMKIFVKDKMKFSWASVGIAICGALNFVFFMIAIQYMPAHISPIFYALVPIEVTIFSFVIYKEKISLKKFLGILVGYSGALFVIIPSIADEKASEVEIIGIFFIVLATSSIALFSVFVQRAHETYSPYNLSFQSILVSLGISIPMAFLSGDITTQKEFRPHVVLFIAVLCLIGTAGQYITFQQGIAKIKASANVVFYYFQPIFVLVMSVVLLNEKVKIQFVLGLILVISGSSLNIFVDRNKPQESIEVN